MNTMYRKRMQLSVFAVAALAIVAVAAVMLLAGGDPARAQNADNTYPNPQPCGPGAATAFMQEPHEVTTGHFALFDAYWQTRNDNRVDDSVGVGVLHTNECPPLVSKKTQTDPVTQQKTVTITRSVSNIDIDEAIMHVLDKHKATVVATNAEATAGQLSLAEYAEVRRGLGLGETAAVPAGTKVWWLKLDDPDTAVDETSDLGMGFSTALLDSKYWYREDDQGNPLKPMRYKFEVESYPSDPDKPQEVPHFFTYKAAKANGAAADLVWDGFKPGVEATDLQMDPGEYEALQWVFTKPGTYVLTVSLQGFVRKNNPYHAVDPRYGDWKPISSNDTETSAAKYTIHVGTDLAEMEPPRFGINLSVAENSPGGAKVGGPIPVYNTEAATLTYGLAGDDSDDFKLVAATAPHTVQIVVKEGASLDYETKASYDLTLSVTDGVDHEDNPDSTVDDTLAVRIALEDVPTRLRLTADSQSLQVNSQVNLTATYQDLPVNADPSTFRFTWKRVDVQTAVTLPDVAATRVGSNFFDFYTTGARKFYVYLDYNLTDGTAGKQLRSNDVEATWSN